MNYTIKEFADRTGLTLGQVQMACYRGRFDCHLSKDVPIQKGGAKQLTMVEETPRTLAHVEKLLRADRANKPVKRTIKLKSGLEVSRCALGYVMMGEQ